MNGPQKHTGRRTQPSGFSLVELLVAMGIMVVGLVMVGALFPTAIKQTESSVEDTLGTIICGNGLAVAKAQLTHPLGVTNTQFANLGPTILGTELRLLTEAELAYPVPRGNDTNYPDDWQNPPNQSRPSSTFGSLVLARRVAANQNDYQLIVLSFHKNVRTTTSLPFEHSVIAERIEVDLTNNPNEDFTRIFVRNIGNRRNLFRRGTPIIVDENDIDSDNPETPVADEQDDALHGAFATLATFNTDTGQGRLDARLSEVYFDVGNTKSNVYVWVVYEADAAGDPVGSSPVMSVLVTRTALQN